MLPNKLLMYRLTLIELFEANWAKFMYVGPISYY